MKETKIKQRIEIQELIGDDQSVMFYDGLDEAIIGTAERINLGPVVAYDVEKVIEILMDRDGMDYATAMEHFDFNIAGGYHGELTPIFIYKITTDKEIKTDDKIQTNEKHETDG